MTVTEADGRDGDIVWSRSTPCAGIDLRVDSTVGGLVLLGPTQSSLGNVDSLLGADFVDPVEVMAGRMVSWSTVSDEVLEVSRLASRSVRAGRTAVVYLDSHVDQGFSVPAEWGDFICTRLGQILIGMADVPAYVVVHGEQMARGLVVESLGDVMPCAPAAIDGVHPLWHLTDRSMFRGLPVAMCRGDRPATAVESVLEWFEARRC